MLHLPSSNSPLRSLFDVAELAVMASPENRQKMPTFRDARLKAPVFFTAEPAARELYAIVVRADGQLWLVRFGRRGGWRRVWNFGQLF